jgi:hypothetical protein
MQVKPDPAPPEKQPELKQRRVVAQKSYRGLDKTGLNTALQELQRELQAGDARTVDLSWEIVAGENVDGENNE